MRIIQKQFSATSGKERHERAVRFQQAADAATSAYIDNQRIRSQMPRLHGAPVVAVQYDGPGFGDTTKEIWSVTSNWPDLAAVLEHLAAEAVEKLDG